MASGLTEEDLLEPHPDVHALFVHYNEIYFENALGGVSVEWSSRRMTSCGGTCQSVPGGAIIKLSQPLLTLRPAKDIKMVLLHEMIHAYCMVKRLRDSDPGGHGAPFQLLMNKINTSTVVDYQRPLGGYNITITHSMFDEVNYYRQHHWRCERCGNEVKRAMNRKPQEADCRWKKPRSGEAKCSDPTCRWHMHLKHCGGEFIKVKEPEGFKKAGNKEKRKQTIASELNGEQPHTSSVKKETSKIKNSRLITEWTKRRKSDDEDKKKIIEEKEDTVLPAINTIIMNAAMSDPNPQPTTERGMSREERCRVLEAAALSRRTDLSKVSPICREDKPIEIDLSSPKDIEGVPCPLCGIKFDPADNAGLNTHIDACLL